MVTVGVHVSIAGSIDRAVSRAMERGCDTFQIFSRNPRGWKYKPIPPDVAAAFIEAVNEAELEPAVVHMPYLPNLASEKEEVYSRSVASLRDELFRCADLNIPHLVTHLGHHGPSGKAEGQKRVARAINAATAGAPEGVFLVMENTAGEKNSVGSDLLDIAAILGAVDDPKRIRVCFDTCHAFAAGYDLRTEEAVGEVFDLFNDHIGLDMLTIIHLNDAKGALGSGLDRHEHIGLGTIGEEGIRSVLRHPRLRHLPFIMETPEDERRDDYGNIKKVRELAI
ncbi:MAG: deoxyribonuclease IV [Methanocalculus sp. MSAO_Arc1]|uniref:deoxyribonuclease IV n=1 Tax=Methanocalculus TaxID=71151 RepID=UPI000FF58B99|nr:MULTISPECIES: deoxyribonuclease IV [unclassified Methanocalculus]MCP1663046.1 deoxyribonuclease-4 [Methanocalculus sp. AMF5]RQD79827.1 MAG: deoxyribonuclease IV [Methanocalculus sp. MSAO_Arc1]